MLNAADYQPPRLLRNPHLQSVLGSSALRRRRGLRALLASGATTTEHILDGGGGARLQGWHSHIPGREARGTALLLHGWEGSAESGYMRLTAARLLADGMDVFRLNFRDHGDTHHLNEGLFHSNRLDEVVHAVADMVRLLRVRDLVVAGYSLGGNFALRVGLRAEVAGLPLRRIAAVCPLVDPATTMACMERAPQIYDWYFRRKWRTSLLRKRALFPEQHRYDDATLALDMRSLTAWLAQRYAGFGRVEDYFDSYSIAGDRLATLGVPANILMAEDDPVIPFDDFHRWRLPPTAQLEVARWGGHCAFVENLYGDGFAERWVAERLRAALPGR
ncbi:alpha/beta fold hydrolase [Pseudoxanthomonas daejeonensis]|uniref:Alpha/beta hydrolase n=1 Tax=Pseudoxanthomonas daejeonensis TaxID=266062 RepID=A0ABQ6ZBR1_9GAMM|nr:alpha/beta fold hydrolase [Pseudoxanthomonas daejeonensis]KAF1697483.1 alpha/beta hydrolase [Pseudoxanthomonas daejeonensis]UNK58659.1 alpha/beta fold hydrolase [Pseudoxanthomonas daejeonensis]